MAPSPKQIIARELLHALSRKIPNGPAVGDLKHMMDDPDICAVLGELLPAQMDRRVKQIVCSQLQNCIREFRELKYREAAERASKAGFLTPEEYLKALQDEVRNLGRESADSTRR